PPEAGGQLHGHAGAAGRLERCVAALGAQNELLEAQSKRILAVALRFRTGTRVVDGHAFVALPICHGPVSTGLNSTAGVRQLTPFGWAGGAGAPAASGPGRGCRATRRSRSAVAPTLP